MSFTSIQSIIKRCKRTRGYEWRESEDDIRKWNDIRTIKNHRAKGWERHTKNKIKTGKI